MAVSKYFHLSAGQPAGQKHHRPLHVRKKHACCLVLLIGAVEKEYIAVAEGVLPDESGTIDVPIGRVEGSIILRKPDLNGQSAVTHYKVIARTDTHTMDPSGWRPAEPIKFGYILHGWGIHLRETIFMEDIWEKSTVTRSTARRWLSFSPLPGSPWNFLLPSRQIWLISWVSESDKTLKALRQKSYLISAAGLL